MNNSLFSAARVDGLGSEMMQDDVSHKADMKKLISIVNSLKIEYPDLLKRVYVGPACIIQSPLADIKDIFFCIELFQLDIEVEEYVEMYKGLRELLKAFIQDEYPEVYSRVKIVAGCDVEYPLLCLLSESKTFNPYADITDVNELNFLYNLASNEKYNIEISYNWCTEHKTTILIHVKDASMLTSLMEDMLRSESTYGIYLEECIPNVKTTEIYTYVPVLGYEPLNYSIPYRFITKEDLNMQIVQDYLDSQITQEHINL